MLAPLLPARVESAYNANQLWALIVTCKCGQNNQATAKFCCKCGESLTAKDIYSVQLGWVLIALGGGLTLAGIMSGYWLLGLLGFPLFFVGIVRIGMAITSGS